MYFWHISSSFLGFVHLEHCFKAKSITFYTNPGRHGSGPPKVSINDMLYKDSDTGFYSLRKRKFPQGLLWVPSIANVCHKVLINVLVFKCFMYPAVDCDPESSTFHRVCKVPASCLPNVAKRCSSNGFLSLWAGHALFSVKYEPG